MFFYANKFQYFKRNNFWDHFCKHTLALFFEAEQKNNSGITRNIKSLIHQKQRENKS